MKFCVAVSTLLATVLSGYSGEDSQAALEYYRAGSKAFVERRFEAAIDALNTSLAIRADNLPALRLLGLSYQVSGRFDEAQAKFQEACRLAPKDGESWFYLGRVYYVRNFFDKALPALKIATKYLPNDARIHECLALTLEATRDAAGAEHEYQQATRGVGGQPGTILMNYGALLLKLDRVNESEQMLVRATTLMPQFWQARFELAKLYYQTDRLAPALRELKTALQCNPQREEASRTNGLLATVYSRLGRQEDSRIATQAAEK